MGRIPQPFESQYGSNRLAGRLFCLLGLAGLMAAPWIGQPLGIKALVGGVLLSAGLSVAESWRVWRADPNRQPF